MGHENVQKLFKVRKLVGKKWNNEYAEKIRTSFANRSTIDQCCLYFDSTRLSRFSVFWIKNKNKSVCDIVSFLTETRNLACQFNMTTDISERREIADKYNELTEDFGVSECK